MRKRPEVIRPDERHFELNLRLNVKAIVAVVIVLILVFWVLRGGPAYTVQPNEEGVITTFGRYTKTTQPGLHFKWPWPIQDVVTVSVTEVRRLEIGLRSHGTGEKASYTTFQSDANLLREAQMLTGDENVVDVSMVVQYSVRNALDYLFNFDSQDAIEATLRDSAEAALRQAVGDHPIDDVLTTGKLEMQSEIREKMQELADRYAMGIAVGEVQLQDVQPPQAVVAAFKDVATAREERERIINEAEAYRSEQIPKAQGEARRLIEEANGYKQARIAEAQGAVARFSAIAQEYSASPTLIRTQLYLDTLAELLPKTSITVIDEDVGVVNLRALGQFGLGQAGSASQ